jgi:hypothetical protein
VKLGKAITYLLRHWRPLTLFLCEAGAPLGFWPRTETSDNVPGGRKAGVDSDSGYGRFYRRPALSPDERLLYYRHLALASPMRAATSRMFPLSNEGGGLASKLVTAMYWNESSA